MKKISETIVFFGSGPVAAKSLDLLSKNFNIEAIITKPRKYSQDEAPVIDLARKLSIPTLMPENKQALDKLISKGLIKSKLGILIDYGIIVSKSVINYFPLGIVNSHFSLLPLLRGADPITFTILNGEKQTGISLMLLTEGMDEGPILAKKVVKVTPDLTSITLTNNLIDASDKLIFEKIPKYLNKPSEPTPQNPNIKPTYSRKLTKTDGKIFWSKPAEIIEREIRAYISWPKSYTKIRDKDIIITRAHVINKHGEPGEFVIQGSELSVFCGKDALMIDELKPSGKKVITTKQFLAGYGYLFN